jgi:hypothetical protein
MDAGDMLLLVGSADCKPFRQGGDGLDNPMLAQNRARAVSEWLKPEMDARGVRVQVVPLDQHKSCRESEELRAVYPFLVHGAQQQPAFH